VRVLGIDPGLTRCGIGVVDGEPGRPLHLVDCHVVTTPATAPLGARLCAVEDALAAAIEQHRPDAVAIERVFSQHNVRTVMGVAQVSGVAVVTATRAGAAVAWHTPSEVKAAVTGNGRAGKEQVAMMVTRLLRLQETPRPVDVTDALALAVCHVWRGGAQQRIAAAVAAQGGRRPPEVDTVSLRPSAARGVR
jgi:crossover junction endodeoxyribonuclease RuvC